MKTVAEEILEAIANVIGGDGAGGLPVPKGTLGLSLKLAGRFFKTTNKVKSPLGIVSPAFMCSAGSCGLTVVAIVCLTGSGVLPLVNCTKFVPLLAAGAQISSAFADKLDGEGPSVL
jgi:hypothetical protein